MAKSKQRPSVKAGRKQLVERTVNIVKRVDGPKVSSPANQVFAKVHEILAVRKHTLQARRGSYRAAMNPRSRVSTPYGGSGDQHVDTWSRRMLRELSRDMDRNADTFGVLNDAFAAAVVGEGVKYRPTTDDPEWNKLVAEKMHARLSMDRGGIDIRGIRTGYRIGYDLVRAFSVDGECGFIKLTSGQIQCFESEQLTNGGKVKTLDVDGVICNKDGTLSEFHICPYNTIGALDYGAGDNFSAENVEWLANRQRFSQTRGVPLIVGGLDDWERLDSFRESEVIAAEQGSQIYGVIEHREGDLGTSRPFSATRGNPSEVIRGGASYDTNNEAGVDWQPTVAGALLDLPDGKKYVPIDPSRPNPEAVPFMMELIRQFCAKAGIPYEYVYNDVRGLSWSVNRALVQMARDRISIWQTQFFGPMFSNLYVWMLRQMIDDGEVEEIDGWNKHELQWSRISWPDEGAEYEAQERGLLKGLTTRHRVHGPMWRDFMDERATELAYAAELATTYNKKFPAFAVTPQFFLGFEEAVTKSETDNSSETVVNGEPSGVKNKNTSPRKQISQSKARRENK